jgi:hypothetical protein
LAGGVSLDVGIANFPHLGERILRPGQDVELYDVSDAQSFSP